MTVHQRQLLADMICQCYVCKFQDVLDEWIEGGLQPDDRKFMESNREMIEAFNLEGFVARHLPEQNEKGAPLTGKRFWRVSVDAIVIADNAESAKEMGAGECDADPNHFDANEITEAEMMQSLGFTTAEDVKQHFGLD